MVPPKIIGDLSLEGSTGEPSPEDLSTFDHQLVRFRNAPIKVQITSLFGISLQLPCKLFLIVLLKLFLNDPNNSRYLIILTPSQQSVHFFVSIITRVQINKALQSCILFIIFKFLLYLVLFSGICDFFKHEGEDIGGCY